MVRAEFYVLKGSFVVALLLFSEEMLVDYSRQKIYNDLNSKRLCIKVLSKIQPTDFIFLFAIIVKKCYLRIY